jgi:hypothetical protein
MATQEIIRTCEGCSASFIQRLPYATYRQKRFCSEPCVRRARRVPPEKRFWAKVQKQADGCWTWTACKNRDGYGLFAGRDKGYVLAHRWAYQQIVGPIPIDQEMDHLCRHRDCVNPSHVEPVPHRVNVLRGEARAAKNARKTHCKHGHPFNEENTYRWRSSGRVCRTCIRHKKEPQGTNR